MKAFLFLLVFSLFISCGKSKKDSATSQGQSDFLITEENSTELAFLMHSSNIESNVSNDQITGLWRPDGGKREEGMLITKDTLVVIIECSASSEEKFYATLKLKITRTSSSIDVPAQAVKSERIELEDGSYITCGKNVEAMSIGYRLSKGKLYLEGDEGEYANSKVLDIDEVSHLL